jgi:hypothetical protein
MGKIMLTVILTVASMCLLAQNHRHFTPYRSESSRIIRIDDTIYEETTIIFVEGLSSTTKVEAKALYSIPEHLRKLDKDIIDSIVRENKKFTVIKLSWFIIWERTYAKENISNQFSLKAVKNLLIVYGIIILFFIILASLIKKSVKKGIRELMKINPSKDLISGEIARTLYFVYAGLVSVTAFIITGIQNNTAELDVWFGFVIYHVIFVFVCYVIMIVFRKIKLRKKSELHTL